MSLSSAQDGGNWHAKETWHETGQDREPGSVTRRSSLAIAGVVAALGSVLLAGAGGTAAGAAGTGSPAAPPAGPGGARWHTAKPIPGLTALNRGGNAAFNSISCATPGNCSAGGFYVAKNSHPQAFVVTETNGVWRTAKEVPGTGSLNQKRAATASVSCPTAGNCSIGGYYTKFSGHQEPFVASETKGVWHAAVEAPGFRTLNAGGFAAINSVSCGAPGNCGAGGYYKDASGHQQAFVITEANGRWGAAVEVPGSGALNAGGFAAINSVSCGAPGNCSAGGYYASDNIARIPITQPFIVSEVNGRWGTAKQVPGAATLNAGGHAAVESVSCTAAGTCSAGGEYTSGAPATQAFVVSETGNRWGRAKNLPGSVALNAGDYAAINSLSCVSAGNCSAGGFYQDASFRMQAFVAREGNGTWGKTEEVPGTGTLNAGASGGATTNSVSCGAPGSCSAGGSYTNASRAGEAFAVIESNGTWHTASEVSGSQALNTGGAAAVEAVSCAAAGRCSAGGFYTLKRSKHVQLFVVDES
jgi:hypothetical protein